MHSSSSKETSLSKDNTVNAFSYDDAFELTAGVTRVTCNIFRYLGHGKYNYLLLGACMLVSLGSGLEMFGLSVVVEASKCDLRLNIFTAGLLNCTPIAGVVLFALPWGYFADRHGRRTGLLLSTCGGFFFGVLSCFSPDWITMFVLKLIGYSFSAGLYTLTMTFLGESIGSSYRRRYLILLNGANLASEIIFYGLAYVILSRNFSWPVPWLGITFKPWRLYKLALMIPLGISALLLITLYESPKILASFGKMEQALKVLNDIYMWNGGKREFPVKTLVKEGEKIQLNGPFWKTLAEQTQPLFKTPLLWRTIQLYYLITICSATTTTFTMWYPMIVNIFFKSVSEGDDQSMSFCERITSNMTLDDSTENIDFTCDSTIHPNMLFAGMLLGLTFVATNLAAAVVASRRRLILMPCFLVPGVCMILVDILKEPVTTMVAFTLMLTTVVGVGSVSSYFVDLYPTSSRGLVSSVSVIFMRMFALAGINIVAHLIVDHCRLTLLGWAVYVGSGAVLALFLPSDQKIYK